MKYFFCLVALLSFYCGYSQVTIEPAFPNINSLITVYYDATQGNGGLKDCNCDVYMHTGLITDKSSSGSDWKYVQGNWGTNDPKVKMTKVADNLYSISYNIKSFYGVPDGEVVKQLAFVFRNVNGSKEGKTSTGGDIFYNMPDNSTNLQFIVSKPELISKVVPLNTIFDLDLLTSHAARITLSINDSIVSDVNGTSLQKQYSLNAAGTYFFNIQMQDDNEVIDTSFVWSVGETPEIIDVPEGMKLGFNYYDQHEAIVVVEAPRKNVAFLVGNFSNWFPVSAFQMHQSQDGQFLWAKVDTSGLEGIFNYQIWFEDGLRILDPLSKEVLDDANDKYIEAITYPSMPTYPKGKTKGLVSHINMYNAYNWVNTNFVKPQKGDLVVYELLIRDFIQSHDYKDLIDTLSYFKRLGVNAIELMPVSEFEGNISWGYNVSLHNAIDKYYGGSQKLKAFVDAAHSQGIAVIADVVFNHAFGQNPMVQMYWNASQNKPANDNPWFNPDARHPYNVGFDFNHESPSTKRYVNQILKDWLAEYRFDGFRFDLSKGFTQTNNPNDVNKWGQYDASRIAILKGYADQIRSVSPDAYIILEHFADNKEEKELSENGMMLWGNSSFDYGENVKGNAANLSWSFYKQRGWGDPNLVSYMESHDEERIMFKAKSEGKSSSAGYNIKNENIALDRVGMAAAFFYTIPGPKMIWQFGEVGYDYSINTCPDGSINNGCRTDPKPIKWDYVHQVNRRKLYSIIAGLTHLKHHFSQVFSSGDIEYDLSGLYKSIIADNDDLKMVVIGNFDVTDGSKAITFPTNEWYYNYLGIDSIQGNVFPKQITLKEGEYKVYLNKKIYNPGFILSSNPLNRSDLDFTVFPNPTSDVLNIVMSENNLGSIKIAIQNLSGIVIKQVEITDIGPVLSLPVNEIPGGVYVLKVSLDNRVGISKVIIVK
jgi:glycosidase